MSRATEAVEWWDTLGLMVRRELAQQGTTHRRPRWSDRPQHWWDRPDAQGNDESHYEYIVIDNTGARVDTCPDQATAERAAADEDRWWPKGAPYRVLRRHVGGWELVEGAPDA